MIIQIKWSALLAIALLWLMTACGEDEIGPTQFCENPPGDTSVLHPKAGHLQGLIDDYTRRGLPGIALLVRDADGRWVGSSGLADIDRQITMQPCHVSKAASVTKLFTGVLVMQLQDDGILDLDDPLTRWLPDKYTSKVANADQVTLRQCLNHTAGIYDIIDDNNFYLNVLNDPARFWEPEDLLKFAYGDAAVFSPGTDLEYSNTNFLLAAMVIKAAAGRPHEDLMREKIFRPLGLQDTYYHWHDPLPGFVAQGYYDLYNNGTLVNMSNFNTGSGNGYGGIYATVFDLQVFIEALLRERTLLPEATLEEMLTITAEDAADLEAYGVAIRKDFLERAGDEYGLGHRGRDLAYTADCFYFPNQDITLAYLINYGTDAESDLRETFFDFRRAIVDLLMEP